MILGRSYELKCDKEKRLKQTLKREVDLAILLRLAYKTKGRPEFILGGVYVITITPLLFSLLEIIFTLPNDQSCIPL